MYARARGSGVDRLTRSGDNNVEGEDEGGRGSSLGIDSWGGAMSKGRRRSGGRFLLGVQAPGLCPRMQ